MGRYTRYVGALHTPGVLEIWGEGSLVLELFFDSDLETLENQSREKGQT